MSRVEELPVALAFSGKAIAVFERNYIPEPNTGCWLWIGDTDHNGYGRLTVFHGNRVLAHRWSSTYFNGPIPEGFDVDHLCNTPACVNPDHLRACTPLENGRRSSSPPALNAKKTHCDYGHEFTEKNTRIVEKNGTRARHCRICVVRRCREYRLRRRAGMTGAP